MLNDVIIALLLGFLDFLCFLAGDEHKELLGRPFWSLEPVELLFLGQELSLSSVLLEGLDFYLSSWLKRGSLKSDVFNLGTGMLVKIFMNLPGTAGASVL